tara:strand:- start:856 stop:1581 length:726 start_codon:yes stop_codon:yes gene_type:complete
MSKYTKKKGIKIKRKQKPKKQIYQISFKEQAECLKNHILINYPFYILTTICIYVLSCKPSNKIGFITMFSSFIYVAFAGYFIHMISHNIHYTKMYDNYPVIYKNIPIIDYCFRSFTWFLDFHHTTHHNSDINKEPHNQLLEGINNFFMQGAIGVMAGSLYNMMDWRMFLFWGIFYASFHIINYTYIEPNVHRDHHLDIYSNYGIDIFDILMGTKNNWNDIEDYNHFSINMIVLTFLIYYII